MVAGTGTSTCRVNLCVNPRGVNAFGAYSSGASQTITPNVAITGHPEGITTANRVTYAGTTPSNPGVLLMPGGSIGTTYSISAWVYFESLQDVPGSTAFAEVGVLSGPAITPVVGSWQRYTWTRTVTSTNGIGFRTAASDGGTGSFLITGIVAENAATPTVNFFDGSTAAQTNLVKVVASQTGGITFTDNVTYAGSIWRRGAVVAGTGGPLIRQFVALTDLKQSSTYTIGVTVANDQAFTQWVTLDWCDTSPALAVSLAPGEQRRLVITRSRSTYDATFRFADISVQQSATEGRSILYKDWLVEEGTTSGDYYATTGDFTYNWVGTPNASISQQKMNLVGGYNSNGRSGMGKSVLWADNRTTSARLVPNTSSKDTYMEVTGFTFETGKTYTISATIRLDQAQIAPESRARRIVAYHSSATLGGTMSQSPQAANAAGVTRVSLTVGITDGAAPQSIRLYNGAGANEGDVWWDSLLIEETDVMRPYFDGGSTPAQDQTHVWAGTAEASVSYQQVTRPSGVSFSGGRFGQTSTEWSARGTKSIKISHYYAPISTNADQFVEIQGMVGTPLLPNTTYTVSGTCRTNQVLGGSLDVRAMKFVIVVNSVQLTINYTKTKANTPGASRVVGTFTTGSATNISFFRLYNGSSYGNGDVWWDELCLEQGVTDGTYFDGSSWSGENLVSNPSMESNITGWAGAGMTPATLSRITSQSQSGSASLQVTCGGTISYQGAFLQTGRPTIKPHMTYTATAWVKGEAGKMMAIECGEIDSSTQLIGRTQSTPVSATGDWQRLSVTRSMGATAMYGDIVIRNINAVSHTFLVDSVMYQQSETPPTDYYAGNGDFSFAWAGAADQSMSYQRALLIGGWGASSNAFIYQSSIAPWNGAKCGAATTQGLAGDGLYANDIPVFAGTTYTFSSWIKLTSALPQFSGTIRWKDTNSQIILDSSLNVYGTMVIGSWTRVSVSAVAPVGATKAQPMWRIYAAHTPTTYYVDGAMMEQSTVMTPYFDGTTSNTTDLTYSWDGIAHQSASSMKASLIPQVIAGKSTGVGYVDSKFFMYSSTAEDGAKTVKWIAPAGTPNSNWRIAGIGAGSSLGWTPNIRAGGTYTLWFRYRAKGWQSSHTFQVQVSDQTSLNTVAAYDAPQTINTTEWKEYRRTFTALRDATTNTIIFISLPLTPQVTTDGEFELREWMLVEGDYKGDFIDGTKPFSKWDGIANQSTSVGYPPQLLDLAGKPDTDLAAVGSTTLSGTWSNTEGRTIYTVYNNLQDISDTGVYPILTYGATALNDVIPNQFITLRLQSATGIYDNSILARRTGGAGASSVGSKMGVNVVSYGLTDTGTLFSAVNNGPVTLDGTFVSDMPHERINILPATAFGSHIRTIIYRGYHDAATRAAVSRYLGNKYGSAVA